MTRNFKKNKDNLQKKMKGFSLIEVMVALFVLAVGVLTTVTLTVNSITQTGDSRDSLIAAALVQEGTELARSIRDENATRAYYDDTLSLFRYFESDLNRSCTIDEKSVRKMRASGNPITCGGSTKLFLDNDDRYTHTGSIGTEFKRETYFRNLVADTSVDVITTVTWNNESMPGPTDRCSLANSCVRNTSTLTAWILH